MRVAGVVIKNDFDEILLLHRATERLAHWEIPGGKIEKNERAAEASVREAHEELVTTVELVREIGSHSWVDQGQNIHYTWFLGKVTGQEPQVGEPNKFDELKYWPLDKLKSGSVKISSGTKSFLGELEAGRLRLGD